MTDTDTKCGLFIVIDGLDGAGKTTQTHALANYICSMKGVIVHDTAEPSTFPIGKLLRAYLTKKERAGFPGWKTMSALFAADRLQHLEHEIEPSLEKGYVVICDRYVPSSIAYQSASQITDSESDLKKGIFTVSAQNVFRVISDMNRHALTPDLTIILDLPSEKAAERRADRGTEATYFERVDFLSRVRLMYHRYVSHTADPMVFLVDADREKDVVQNEMQSLVNRTIQEHIDRCDRKSSCRWRLVPAPC